MTLELASAEEAFPPVPWDFPDGAMLAQRPSTHLHPRDQQNQAACVRASCQLLHASSTSVSETLNVLGAAQGRPSPGEPSSSPGVGTGKRKQTSEWQGGGRRRTQPGVWVSRLCQVSVEPDPTAGERDKLLRGQPGMLSPLGGLWPGLFSPRHSHRHGHSELRHFLLKRERERGREK